MPTMLTHDRPAAIAVAIKPITATTTRFELPALEFKFASLTDGTDIPAPLPSPVDEGLPSSPGDSTHHLTADIRSHTAPASVDRSKARLSPPRTTADGVPLSPTLSSRQGSIRRLFSRNKLNDSADVDALSDAESSPAIRDRPPLVEDRKTKRNSGWFRRLRPADPPRQPVSPVSDHPAVHARPAGPPPPMIPELAVLDTASPSTRPAWGTDLFTSLH